MERLGRPAERDCRSPEIKIDSQSKDLSGITASLFGGSRLRSTEHQQAAVAAFIQKTLYNLGGEPTLVVTHAQNSRTHWPWLQNGNLIRDRIRIGGGPAQRLALHGKHLRVARVRDGDRNETPQWWAPKDEDHAGISKGLWVPVDARPDNRVFASTTEKAGTHTLSVEATKLTTHMNTTTGRSEINVTKTAWNPDLLEIVITGAQESDNPETWAMLLHQQRFPDDYRNGLALPLILHLAKLASEYALPHEDPEQANVTDPVPEAAEDDMLDLDPPDQEG